MITVLFLWIRGIQKINPSSFGERRNNLYNVAIRCYRYMVLVFSDKCPYHLPPTNKKKRPIKLFVKEISLLGIFRNDMEIYII